MQSIGKTISRFFNVDPFWFIIVVFILLQVGSCSARNIYCDWVECSPKDPKISIKLGKERKI